MGRFTWIVGTALTLALLFAAGERVLHAQDGIPDNCEFSDGAYYQSNVFPRYEPQNQRLVLVSWTTGQDVQIIATALADTRILGWSVDCRYLATAVGPAESMDTVVWDVTNSTRVGAVPDAHLQPHHITWGPNGYLVVETRSGAVLWNVPANSQVILTTSFNTTTARNFSRLRWNAQHNQLTANLAVGGRVVYDLATGQEVPVAATVPQEALTREGGVVIGGSWYECAPRNSYSYSLRPRGVYIEYNVTANTVALMLDDQGRPDETLQMVEANLDVPWFQVRGWSSSCRYFAVSLGIADRDASDTVVWDIVENRRVGVFENAQEMPHPLHWSTFGDALVIETRDGTYLWHLPTDTRTLINPHVETAVAGNRGIRTFHSLDWDEARGQLLMVQIGSGSAVTAYDMQTGQQVGFYPSGGEAAPVGFSVSPDGSRIAVVSYGENPVMTVWNRDTGAGLSIVSGVEFPSGWSSAVAFSPDNHYLVISAGQQLRVWDLQNPQSGGAPTYMHEGVSISSPVFVDNVMVTPGYNRSFQINVVTGERVNVAHEQAPVESAALPGQTGWSEQPYYYWHRFRECEGVYPEYDAEARRLVLEEVQTDDLQRVIEENLNAVGGLRMSPDCRFISGEVSIVNNTDFPYDDAPVDDRYTDRLSETLVIWDVQTGQRLQQFPNAYRRDSYSLVLWSPAGERAFVRTTAGHFIWDSDSNQTVLLTYDSSHATAYSGGIYSYPAVYWDYQRGQVIVNGWQGAFAFDLVTGSERYLLIASDGSGSSYGSGCHYSCGFSVDPSNSILFVQNGGAVGVWNMDSLEHTHVDIRYGTGYLGNRISLSPDGRYLVIARAMIRVWDLSNLPDDFDERDPIYSYHGPWARVQSAHFVDNVTLETNSSEGVQRWNVETGELISQ